MAPLDSTSAHNGIDELVAHIQGGARGAHPRLRRVVLGAGAGAARGAAGAAHHRRHRRRHQRGAAGARPTLFSARRAGPRQRARRSPAAAAGLAPAAFRQRAVGRRGARSTGHLAPHVDAVSPFARQHRRGPQRPGAGGVGGGAHAQGHSAAGILGARRRLAGGRVDRPRSHDRDFGAGRLRAAAGGRRSRHVRRARRGGRRVPAALSLSDSAGARRRARRVDPAVRSRDPTDAARGRRDLSASRSRDGAHRGQPPARAAPRSRRPRRPSVVEDARAHRADRARRELLRRRVADAGVSRAAGQHRRLSARRCPLLRRRARRLCRGGAHGVAGGGGVVQKPHRGAPAGLPARRLFSDRWAVADAN